MPTLVRFCRALSREEGDPVRFITADKLLAAGFGRRPEFRTHIAELAGRPVGYTFDHDAYSSCYCERGIFLVDLYVVPRARRRGVARALLAAVARAGRRRRRTFIWWTSIPGNAGAHAFYAGIGAREFAVREHVLGTEAMATLAGGRG
ncbi:GNAT family N-acetyltransferase [Stella sp.]|uniref:GNAT family N-acetyltransferase n=1 Tax=Stella sp. TaxID=2912054 RepID=UPI0035B48E71